MYSVAARLNLRIPRGKQGHAGKAIKALYAARYDGHAAASRIHKRNVPFRGKIFAENTYWLRDVDLMEQAAEAVVQQNLCSLAFAVSNDTQCCLEQVSTSTDTTLSAELQKMHMKSLRVLTLSDVTSLIILIAMLYI
jgi:hypothetical protein